MSTPWTLPPADELDDRLLAFAATGPDRRPTAERNELLRLWNGAPGHALALFEHHFELWKHNLLGPRLTELVRLSIANQTGCPVCLTTRLPQAQRDGLDEAAIAAIAEPDSRAFSDRERAAIGYATALAGDHRSIDSQTYQGLARLFSPAELAELTMMAQSFLGMGRVLETLTRDHAGSFACPLPGNP